MDQHNWNHFYQDGWRRLFMKWDVWNDLSLLTQMIRISLVSRGQRCSFRSSDTFFVNLHSEIGTSTNTLWEFTKASLPPPHTHKERLYEIHATFSNSILNAATIIRSERGNIMLDTTFMPRRGTMLGAAPIRKRAFFCFVLTSLVSLFGWI